MRSILLFALIASVIFPAFASAQLNLNLDYPVFGGIDLNCPDPQDPSCGQNLNTLIAWLYYFIIGIAGLAAFVMLVWGGIQWLTSGAIPSQASEARDKLRAAFLGLLLILASFLIIQIINPQLTVLNQPGLQGLSAPGSVPAFSEETPPPGEIVSGGGVGPGGQQPGTDLPNGSQCTANAQCASGNCVFPSTSSAPDDPQPFSFLRSIPGFSWLQQKYRSLLHTPDIPGILKAQAQSNILPYDHTNPVMYDNDYTNDYTDWILMAAASAGEISYRGIITSSSIQPYNRHISSEKFDRDVKTRTDIVEIGRRSGLRNVPNPVTGTRGNLLKPSSGNIDETVPLRSPGSSRIISEARNATAAKPLVVVMGGPLTVVADAYLQDPSIADKMVVAWVGGRGNSLGGDYNGWADGWAAYIALERLRLIQFPVNKEFFPMLTRPWIRDNLPDSEAKDFMLGLDLDVLNDDSLDVDGMPVASVLAPGYVQSVKRVSFSGWEIIDGHEVPLYRDDPNGSSLVVTQVNRDIASQTYRDILLSGFSGSGTAPPPETTPPTTFGTCQPAPGGQPGGTGTRDVFDIEKLYADAPGGPSWDASHWSQFGPRTFGSAQHDPNDPTGWSRSANGSTNHVDGNGLLIPKNNDPRFYIDHENFLNTEFTAYFKRINDTGLDRGGLMLGVRSGNHSDGNCAHTYYARIGYSGRATFVKELVHPTAFEKSGVRTTLFAGGMPKNQWIGMKFVVYNTSSNSVKLEMYSDTTDGANGGSWQKVLEFEDTGGWVSGGSTCLSGDDYKILGAAFPFIRNTEVFDSQYKNVSVREITPP